jgi:hypothetical protein
MKKKPHRFAPPGTRTPLWRDIAGRFSNDRECLASFLALETAEILEGVKPGNLINVTSRRQPCDRNLYALWQAYGEELVEAGGLSVKVMRERNDSLLLFIYDSAALSRLLAENRVRTMLNRAGYWQITDLDKILAELKERIGSGSFPHEVGIFLGYPLKDVAAFMGWALIPFTCQGPWKIYGDPRRSLETAASHHECRCRMAWRVAGGDNPLDCLRRGAG